MKTLHRTIISSLLGVSTGLIQAQSPITIGGSSATKPVDLTSSWVVNDTVYDLGTLNGGSVLNWEGINSNVPIVDNGTSWDWLADAGPNYTNGMMFIYDQSIDLSTLGPQGMAAVSWTVDFEASALPNWIPVLEVNDGVDTRYYMWRVTVNHWRDNNPKDFTTQGEIGVAANWGEILNTSTGINTAYAAGNNPAAMRQEILDFDGTNWVTDGATPGGVIRFGFIQWGAASSGTVNTTVNLAVQAFEVTITDAIPTPDAYVGGGTAGSTPDPTDVTQWTTNNVLYNQDAMVGVNDGYACSWENVTQNDAAPNGTNNVFDQTWDGGTNYTIGHLFMYTAESVDLSTLSAGITRLGFSASFTVPEGLMQNWIPIMAIETGGVTTYYRSSEAGNVWRGDGLKLFRDPAVVADPSDWAGLRESGVTSMNGARDPSVQPHIRPMWVWNFPEQKWELTGTPPAGTATFGFMQWGGSTGSTLGLREFSTAVNSFEVLIYSDESDLAVPPDPEGLEDIPLDSAAFLYKYEMEVNPSTQDLDGAGSPTDWFPTESQGRIIPQTYVGGVAFSDQNPSVDVESFTISIDRWSTVLDWTLEADAEVSVFGGDDLEALGLIANVPSGTTTYTDQGVLQGGVVSKRFYRIEPIEALFPPEVQFRTDFSNPDSIQRQSLLGTDFTLEVALRAIGPRDAGDIGVFAMAFDPGGAASAFRLNVDLDGMSLNNNGDSPIGTTSNSDAMHVFRIAYNIDEDSYWVFRDGVMIYGANVDIGVPGTHVPFNNNGSMWLGDFSDSISGEWEVDYIRLHDTAVAPVLTP